MDKPAGLNAIVDGSFASATTAFPLAKDLVLSVAFSKPAEPTAMASGTMKKILNTKKEKDLTDVVNHIKDIDTQIKQLKHVKEGLINQLEPHLNAKHEVYGLDRRLIATRVPYLRRSLNQKRLLDELPEVEEFFEEKMICSRWRWL